MFYREAGEFSTSYRQDAQTFPIAFDRWRYYLVLAVGFGVVPFLINDYWANAVLIPFLVWSMAALGLNILSGYCGQVSLGTGGFMAVGAYACYKLMTAFPGLNIVFCILLAGLITAFVGVSVRPSVPEGIKAFYLAVATLAAQFFFVWSSTGPGSHYSHPNRSMRRRGHFWEWRSRGECDSAVSNLFCLAVVVRVCVDCPNLTRGRSDGLEWRCGTWTSPQRSSASTRSRRS